MNKFFLYYSLISTLSFLFASVVFFTVYKSVDGGIWAAFAGCVAGICFHLHKLYFDNKLQIYISLKALNYLAIISFIIFLLGASFSIWYLFTIIYWKIPLTGQNKPLIFPCVFSFLTEAWALKEKFKQYVLEKEYAKAGIARESVNKCFCSKIVGSCESNHYKPNASLKRNSLLDGFLLEDTIQNFILKSVLGFLGGIFLTYVCFMFLIFSLNFTLKRATYICMGLGIVLSLGLAFSVKIRCTVFLCIPQLFSKRGRQALLAYAFILALSGPAKNTLHNVEVMSESLACGQEQIKQAENELLKCVQKPNAAAKKSVEKLLEKINNSVKYFKHFIFQFYRTCYDVLETLFHGQKWLYSISLLCNEKMGDPNRRCENLFFESLERCEGADTLIYWKRLCQMNPLAVKRICSTHWQEICSPNDVRQHLPVGTLQKQLNTFKRHALNILYVRVEVHQTYLQSNRSNTFHEEYQGMATEIRQKTDQFLQYFDFMSVIFGIFILVLFVKVIIYRHKFLTEDHYDNRFITPDFEDIDNTRAEFQMETILPLNSREKTIYIKVTSIRLVPCEKIRLLSSFVFLIFATFKIIIHMLTDSSLYWILSSVRRNERLLYMSTMKEEEPGVIVRVMGNGFVAAFLKNVTDAVRQQYSTTKLDPTPCLPDPVSPDWNRYYQIIALVLICWLLALFEPYGLRLRHSVMVTYHPDRARERAIWLYNRIISNRNSFVKISRRVIRRKYRNAFERPVFRFQLLRKEKSLRCLLCQARVVAGDNHVKCRTENCMGIFCFDCYSILKCCTICTDPKEYGDLSDLSEEKDSSEDEKVCKCKKIENSSSEKKKESIKNSELIKKPVFEFEKVFQDSLSKKRNSSHEGLLIQGIRYCRRKISKLETGRNLSGSESSIRDSDRSDRNKKWLGKAKGEESRKKEKNLIEPKRKAKKSDQEESRGSRRSQETVSVSRKPSVLSSSDLLFKYVSRTTKSLSRSVSDPKERPAPDFLFINVQKGGREFSCADSIPLLAYQLSPCLLPEREIKERSERTFLKVKDSSELTRKFLSGEMREKLISARGRSQEEMVEGPKFAKIHKETQTAAAGQECSSAKFSRVRFVDEKDLKDFDGPSTGGDRHCRNLVKSERTGILKTATNPAKRKNGPPEEMKSPREELRCTLKTEESAVSDPDQRESLSPYSLSPRQGRVKICTRRNSYRICTKEETTSSETDHQFCSEPGDCGSSDSKSFGRDDFDPKRTSAKMNIFVESSRYRGKMYSVEEDGSNGKRSSGKPSRKGKSLRKNGVERKCSGQKNSDGDEEERGRSEAAVFRLDEDGRRRRSRKKLGEKTKGEKKSEGRRKSIGRLSWAPDLLSDLPSSKGKESGASTDSHSR